MAFKLAINPFFWTPVKLRLVGDMNVPIEVEFKAKYKRLAQPDYEALLARLRLPVQPADAQDLEDATEAAKAEGRTVAWRVTDKEVVEQVLLDWDGIVDEDDQVLAYTPDNLERVEKVLGVRAALVNAFFDAHVLKAPEKNSGTRRGASTT
jgi:hypothetical protein